jgi:hypothetical protein
MQLGISDSLPSPKRKTSYSAAFLNFLYLNVFKIDYFSKNNCMQNKIYTYEQGYYILEEPIQTDYHQEFTVTKDRSGSDSHGIGFRYFLPYFNSNTDMDSDILEYECKMDTSDLDIYSIGKIMFNYFLLVMENKYNFLIDSKNGYE